MMLVVPAMGHNGGPALTPFEVSRDEIDALFAEGKNWLDGKPVETQAEAEGVAKLLMMTREAAARADERRAAEKRPHDEAAAEVQGRYNTLLAGFKASVKGPKGRATILADACRAALQPFLARQEAEKQAAAEAARRHAEAQARDAALAFAVSAPGDLEAREQAEAMAVDAKTADRAAGRAERDRAVARGGARATKLRTTYRAEVVDAVSFVSWAMANATGELIGHLTTMAERRVAAGFRDTPGIVVREEKKVV